jgi:hypothetical protein
MGVLDLVWGDRPGAVAGFFLGGGLFALIAQVPVARAVWRLERLVRHADGRKAFE